MKVSGNVLWGDEREISDLIKLGSAEGPLDQKVFSCGTLIRNATKIVFYQAEHYARKHNYDVAAGVGLGYDPTGNHHATLDVKFYRLKDTHA